MRSRAGAVGSFADSQDPSRNQLAGPPGLTRQPASVGGDGGGMKKKPAGLTIDASGGGTFGGPMAPRAKAAPAEFKKEETPGFVPYVPGGGSGAGAPGGGAIPYSASGATSGTGFAANATIFGGVSSPPAGIPAYSTAPANAAPPAGIPAYSTAPAAPTTGPPAYSTASAYASAPAFPPSYSSATSYQPNYSGGASPFATPAYGGSAFSNAPAYSGAGASPYSSGYSNVPPPQGGGYQSQPAYGQYGGGMTASQADELFRNAFRGRGEYLFSILQNEDRSR